MKFLDLEPSFLKITATKTIKRVKCLKDADGVEFYCPKCLLVNRGTEHTHRMTCWQIGVDKEFLPSPGRWDIHGNSFADLSLSTIPTAVRIIGDCRAKFYVQNGEVLAPFD